MSETKTNNNINTNNYSWDDKEEEILKGWSEKGSCYQLMHDRSHKKYWCLNTWFAIPIIILSTVTGTGNFAQESFGPEYKYYIIYTIATLNILVAIMSTVSQYLQLGQNVEGHRLASVSWDKFSRSIKVELSKDRNSRQNVDSFILNCQEQYDRLVEITPNMPSDSIRWFRKLVKDGVDRDEKKGCRLCCYQMCCFSCGLDCCNIKCCCKKNNEEEIENIKKSLQNIELPEILGYIKPIDINNKENDYKNKYDIYNNV